LGLVFSHALKVQDVDHWMTLIPTLDLFSGIGGFSLALRGATRTVAYCDISPKSRAVLEDRQRAGSLDAAPVFDDVTKLTAAGLRAAGVRCKVDLITAGFPCQDISASNPHGLGIRGDRSGLFSEVVRMADELGAQAVVLENSPLLVTRGIEVVLRRLRTRGFHVAWALFAAADVGALHIRRRWFCVAARDTAGGRRAVEALRKMRMPADPWAGGEPVARVVRRTATRSNLQTLRRGQVLGNSVVPQCVRHAVRTLASALGRARAEADGRLNAAAHPAAPGPARTANIVMRIPPSMIVPPLGRPVYRYTGFATPTAKGCWHQTRIGTRRASQQVTNQIMYDQKTLRSVATIMPTTPSAVTLWKHWVVNPAFVEWLMGYPRGWTTAAAEPTATAARTRTRAAPRP
jgi:hypothetical protein